MSLVYLQGGMRPVLQGEPNGLENPEDRRSAGWHGNQYVCLRRPQVSRLRQLHVLMQVDFPA